MDTVVRGRRVVPLSTILAQEFRDPTYRSDLLALVGDLADDAIEHWVAELTFAHLGVRPTGALYALKSVGAVFCLVLEHGELAVLKMFNRASTLRELTSMHECMLAASAHGFPVPRLRSELFEATPGVWAVFYTFIDGYQRDAHEPAVRRELARSLAELASVLAPLDASALPPSPTRLDTLWPAPHRVWDQRALDSDESRLCDRHASEAQAVIKKSKLQRSAMHLDWGVKNVRFRDDRIAAVYDWDSLHQASEAECAGRAAAQFTAQWEIPALLTPTPEEAKAFLDEYQAARGKKFSRAERAIAAASARYLVAHVARQELASGVPLGDNYRGLLQGYDDDPLL